MKQSGSFVFPSLNRWIVVAVILLSLLSIAAFSYAKLGATHSAHAATTGTLTVIVNDPLVKGVVSQVPSGGCTNISTSKTFNLINLSGSVIVAGMSATGCGGTTISNTTVTFTGTNNCTVTFDNVNGVSKATGVCN
jgi:hypothetical protein